MIRITILILAIIAGTTLSATVRADEGFTDYSPGIVKSLIEKGSTILVDYSAEW